MAELSSRPYGRAVRTPPRPRPPAPYRANWPLAEAPQAAACAARLPHTLPASWPSSRPGRAAWPSSRPGLATPAASPHGPRAPRSCLHTSCTSSACLPHTCRLATKQAARPGRAALLACPTDSPSDRAGCLPRPATKLTTWSVPTCDQSGTARAAWATHGRTAQTLCNQNCPTII